MDISNVKDFVLERDPFDVLNWDYLEVLLGDFTDQESHACLKNWEAHLEWWEMEFGKKDKKYLKATEREQRKNIIDFIEQGLNDRDWNTQKTHSRDNYLFPKDVSLKILKEILDAVHDEIKTARGQASTERSRN